MLYTTKDLYGTDDLSRVGMMIERAAFKMRVYMLETTKTRENAKHMSVRDAYLIKKIVDAQSFWNTRLKETKR